MIVHINKKSSSERTRQPFRGSIWYRLLDHCWSTPGERIWWASVGCVNHGGGFTSWLKQSISPEDTTEGGWSWISLSWALLLHCCNPFIQMCRGGGSPVLCVCAPCPFVPAIVVPRRDSPLLSISEATRISPPFQDPIITLLRRARFFLEIIWPLLVQEWQWIWPHVNNTQKFHNDLEWFPYV